MSEHFFIIRNDSSRRARVCNILNSKRYLRSQSCWAIKLSLHKLIWFLESVHCITRRTMKANRLSRISLSLIIFGSYLKRICWTCHRHKLSGESGRGSTSVSIIASECAFGNSDVEEICHVIYHSWSLILKWICDWWWMACRSQSLVTI